MESYTGQARRAIEEVAREAIESGAANLFEIERQAPGFAGPGFRLEPSNPAACPVEVFPMEHQIDLLLGPEGHLHEIPDPDEVERLERVRECIEAVLAGRYDEQWRQVRRLRWFRRSSRSLTQLVMTFRTARGAIVVTHEGAEPENKAMRRRFAPYGCDDE